LTLEDIMILPYASMAGVVGLLLATGGPSFGPATTGDALNPAVEKNPKLIVFYGDPKAKRFAFRDSAQNYAIMAPAPAAAAVLDTAGIAKWPGMKIAAYYGDEVTALPKTPAELAALDLTKAKVRGRYYPASGKRPAVLGWLHAFTGKLTEIHVVPDSVLTVLKKAGIPVKLAK
jgi:hypothetical protein